ncbi:MAG TPA: hypothetical protein VIF14_14185 [Alphaproteobacteria bacterium]|jgi:hypothetical protein
MGHVPGKSSPAETLDRENGINPAAVEEPAAVQRSAENGQAAEDERPDAAAPDDRNIGALAFARTERRCTELSGKMRHISFDLAFAPDLRLLSIADLLRAVLDLAPAKRR